MNQYKHVLVGVDLTVDESTTVINKAKILAQSNNATISLAHVIEPLVFAYAGEIPIDLASTQTALEEHANKQLQHFAKEHGIENSNAYVLLGPTAAQLHECANKHNADLLVVGSHGRHGLALIFGSTASDVIHGAKCDVLAVRV